jgi:hypothetical protein
MGGNEVSKSGGFFTLEEIQILHNALARPNNTYTSLTSTFSGLQEVLGNAGLIQSTVTSVLGN